MGAFDDELAALRASELDNGDHFFLDWVEVFAGTNNEHPVVNDLAYPGRWTAIVAPAKAGKSAFTLHVATELIAGRDPIDGDERGKASVWYLDAEMGRLDVRERLEALDLGSGDMELLRYTDLVPKLNTVAGAARLLSEVKDNRPDLVIIDGISGAIQGDENDNTTWLTFYDWTIAPLKQAGIAVWTSDNLGKDRTLGPRGSSVKMDKADAIVMLERTDNGLKLTIPMRRTAAYPKELLLDVFGDDDDAPRFRRTSQSWVAGTAAKAAELDEIGVPTTASKAEATRLLKAAGRTPGKTTVLVSAQRYRRTEAARADTTPAVLRPPQPVDKPVDKAGNQAGNHQLHLQVPASEEPEGTMPPEQGEPSREPPGTSPAGEGEPEGVTGKEPPSAHTSTTDEKMSEDPW